MGKFDFDEIIDRRGTNAINLDAAREFMSQGDPSVTEGIADEDIIRMWVADMEFACPPVAIEAMRARLDRRIFGYSAVSDEGFYTAFETWCAERYGWSFGREELIFSPGVVPALYQIAEDQVRPGEKILILTPSYAPFSNAASRIGAELVCSPLKCEDGRFTIDYIDLKRKASDPKVKMLIFCNPHNPTGRVWTEEELREVAGIVEENDLWLVSDEIHCDVLRSGLRHIPFGKILPDYRKLVTCMSASKTFNLAGLSMSEILIRDEEERRLFRKNSKALDVNPLSVEAHKAVFGQGWPWLEEMRAYLDDNFRLLKDFLDKNFPRTHFQIPEATYLAWVDFRAYLPKDAEITKFFARRAAVALEGGDGMFVGNAKGFVRLNIAMPRPLLAEGLRRIRLALNT